MIGDPLPAAAAFLVTFAIHGTVVLAVVLLLVRVARVAEPVEEALLRFALVGGLASAGIQLALGGAPLATIPVGELRVAVDSASEIVPAPAPAPRASAAARPDAPRARTSPGVGWPGVVVGLCGALAAVGLARLGMRRTALRRMLADRRPVVGGAPARVALEALAVRAGVRGRVRLSVCAAIDSPVALGFLRPEICVPRRALTALSEGGRNAMLAHELAHVARRDPLWLELAHALRALFPWQPLLGVASRRLRVIAELRCDAVGAALVGPVDVADCLVEVAGWLVEGRGPAVAEGLVGMTVQREGLSHRVERLLDGERRAERRVNQVVLALGLGAATAVLAAGLPGARGAPAERVAAESSEAVTVPARVAAPVRAESGGLSDVLDAVDAERDALAAEIDALHEEVAPRLPDPELSALLEALDRRVESLDARRAALRAAFEAFLDARPASVEPSPSREEMNR